MNRVLKRWFISMTFIMSTLVSITCNAVEVSSAEPSVRELFLTHHEFEDWSFTPKVNDKVLIHNHADISHSIYITYPDGTVMNLGVQLPGETVTWTIPTSGNYLLQCWIHPVIRTKMTVTP